MVSSSRPRNAGTTCAGGSSIDSEPMPIIDEPNPDMPRTKNANSVASAIATSIAALKPSIVMRRASYGLA